jgi:hypothetical protein
MTWLRYPCIGFMKAPLYLSTPQKEDPHPAYWIRVIDLGFRFGIYLYNDRHAWKVQLQW